MPVKMVAKQDGQATVASDPWHHEQRTWSGLASPPQLGHFIRFRFAGDNDEVRGSQPN